MSESELYDLIIIGGGPGGLSAGIYAMRAALKTVLVEMGAPGGQVNNSDSVESQNYQCHQQKSLPSHGRGFFSEGFLLPVKNGSNGDPPLEGS